MSASKQVYLQGETATFSVADHGYAAVKINLGGTNVAIDAQMQLAEGKWSVSISTADLVGAFRFAILADGALVEEGEFSVRVLVSKYRTVIAAIDEAMQKAGTTGTSSVSVGEINLTNKTFDEMRKWRAYYLDKAVAEEHGESADACAMPQREDMYL